MEEDLRALLRASTAVTSITPRIEWGSVAQGAQYPLVVLNTISGSGSHTLDGPDSLFSGRVQVDCYATTMGGAVNLGRAVLGVLDGHADGEFQGIFHNTTRSTREGGTDEASRPYRVSMDFMVVHSD